MAKMLILVGPQGSGNHLWSKIFSLHPEVYGWRTLLDNYWEPHRFNEPFADYWRNPQMLEKFDWSMSEYYFTSISIPLGIIGSDANPVWEPNLQEFAEAVKSQGIDVQIAVIGRDQTILEHQQRRIRTAPTLSMFLKQLPMTWNPIFLSYELLYLYKKDYLSSLKLNIPVAYQDARLFEILEHDANIKYIHSIEDNPLDQGNKTGKTFQTRP